MTRCNHVANLFFSVTQIYFLLVAQYNTEVGDLNLMQHDTKKKHLYTSQAVSSGVCPTMGFLGQTKYGQVFMK